MKKLRTFFGNMAYMFRYSWKLNKARFFFAAFNIVMQSIEPFLYLILPKFIIDELAGACRWEYVVKYICMFVGTILIFKIIKVVESSFDKESSFKNGIRNSFIYADLFLVMDYEKLENDPFRNLAQRMSENIGEYLFLEDLIASLLINIIQLLGYTYIVATLHPLLIAFILLMIFLSSKISKSKEKLNYDYQPITVKYQRRAGYLGNIMTNFDYEKEIQINNVSRWLKSKYIEETNKCLNIFREIQNKYLKFNSFSAVLSFLQTIVMYGYCAYKAISGSITVGSFSVYLGAITNFTGAFTNVIAQGNRLIYYSKYVDEYKEFVELATPRYRKREQVSLKEIPSEEKVFEFVDVSFRYPNTDRFVLKHVSLKIDTREKLSVVGYNGAGKSTFIKLLCRLYEPTEGKILYNGVDIFTINYDEYIELLSVVFQDYKIYSVSVRENIVTNRPYDEQRLLDAVEKSGLGPKIEALKYGLDTQVNKTFDPEGIEFSGGEGQRLACARAYYRNTPVVILDEPTASLDVIAEAQLYERFHNIIGERMAIYISHRLASVKFCDKIAVFVDGEIVETGTHAELMAKNGVYADMFQKQAMYYREEVSAE